MGGIKHEYDAMRRGESELFGLLTNAHALANIRYETRCLENA
jgi:hypothetical protein